MEEIKKGQEDSEIVALGVKVKAGETSRYAMHDGMLYCLSGRDEEIRLRLYVLMELRAEILEQIHEKLGPMGIDKTCDLMGRTYYWLGLRSPTTFRIVWCVRSRVEDRRWPH